MQSYILKLLWKISCLDDLNKHGMNVNLLYRGCLVKIEHAAHLLWRSHSLALWESMSE